MKNALILHGTDGNSQENWLPWLKTQLEGIGYKVWVPDLPQANQPSVQRYNKLLLKNKDWQFDEETILIGHSSGAVAILGLLQALPKTTCIKASYLVGSFMNDLDWDSLKELFTKPFDFEKIKLKSQPFYFIHSDNDPYCPLDHARYLNNKIGGELIVLPDQQHFSINTGGEHYSQFPQLLKLIVDNEQKSQKPL